MYIFWFRNERLFLAEMEKGGEKEEEKSYRVENELEKMTIMTKMMMMMAGSGAV